MCLTVTNIVNTESARVASDLDVGTWFRDVDGQVYVTVNNDSNDEFMVICVGSYFKPFVVQIPASQIVVSEILSIGTSLEISKDYEGGF